MSVARVEGLEGRRLMDATLIDGVIRAVGEANSSNVISITFDESTVEYVISINGVITNLAAAGTRRVVVHGGAQADSIFIDPVVRGRQSIFAYAGNDNVTAGNARDEFFILNPRKNRNPRGWTKFFGMEGNDVLTATGGRMIMDGGAGDDVIIGSQGTHLVAGDTGNDQITTGGANDTILGGEGNDTIESGSGDDTVIGEGGADSITAGDGNDLVFGVTGPDTIFGGNGLDTLFGNGGIDFLFGEGDNDTLIGGQADDNLDGGGQDDKVVQRAADDEVERIITEGGEVLGPDADPSNLLITEVNNSASLTWTDSSTNETGFRIVRSTTGLNAEEIEVGTVGANVVAFTDSTAASGETYNYSVFAVRDDIDSTFSADGQIIMS